MISDGEDRESDDVEAGREADRTPGPEISSAEIVSIGIVGTAQELVLEKPGPADPLEVRLGPRWGHSRLLALGVLPALATLSAAGAGFLGWQYASRQDTAAAAIASVAAARDTTVTILSYKADTAEEELTSARDLLTGKFLDSFTTLVNDEVIPGAKEKRITATAEVPAAASIAATAKHAVALVFVDQSVTAGNDAPTNTSWSVRVTLDKVGDRWLVAGFDPV